MEVGLASSIVTFLDITVKIVARTCEFLDQAENAPASLRCIDHRLPLLEKSLQLIHHEILLHRVDAGIEVNLLRVLKAVKVELERLEGYVTILSPQNVLSKLQKFNCAIKSVLVYEGKINRALKRLDGYVDTLSALMNSIVVARTGRIEESTTSTSQVLATLMNDNGVTEGKRERDAILAWLDGMPRDSWIDACLEGRCPTWMFNNQTYLAWSSKTAMNWPSRFLWIHGPAGCGKTFMAATMFDCFESNDIEAAAVFWNSGGDFENAALDEIPRSWVRQLLEKRIENYDYIKPIWLCSKSSRALPQEVWKALESLLSLTTSSGITLFLDGLDVYQEQQRKRAKSFRPSSHQALQHASIRDFAWALKTTLEGQDCRFVCFSRPDAEIRSQLSPSRISEGLPYAISAWQHAITAVDIREEFFELAFDMVKEQLPGKEYGLKIELAHLTADRAVLHMSVRIMQREISCLKSTYSGKKLRKMLDQCPDHFDDIYQADLDRIKQLSLGEQRRAWRMLHWVANALRPLTVQELLEAILIEEEIDEFPDDDLPEDLGDEAIYGEIQELCGSFITFEVGDHPDDLKSWKVRLAHHSFKRLLVQETCTVPKLQSSSPHTTSHRCHSVGLLCIRYLMYNNVWPSAHTVCESTPLTVPNHPLLAYVATHFHRHVRDCTGEERTEVAALLKAFLGQHFDRFSTWHWLVRKRCEDARIGADSPPLWNWGDRLAFAAAVGLLDVIQQFQPLDRTVSCALSEGLCAACWRGSIELIDALLEKGAELDQVAPSGSAPLHVASSHGQVNVVEYLIERGANVNVATERGGTALHYAVEGEHDEIVRILLSRGADATIARCVDGYLPLHAASKLRRLACVQALASSQPALSQVINATTTQGWSALGFAVSHTDRETDRELVKLLLHHGADPLQMYSDGHDPFFICAQQGNYHLFVILGSAALRQAVGNIKYTAGQSLLFAAVMGGHCDIVQDVLYAGVNWNHRNEQGKTALDLAELLHRQNDITHTIVWYIAKSHNGIAYLANALTASPPEQQEKLEQYMDILHHMCLEQKVTMPEILVKHLETCHDEGHAATERRVKEWAELE